MAKKKQSARPKPPEESAPPTALPPKPRMYDSLRENIEALVVAVILAISIRHFAVEAFEIPTGSMAPTLYGMHTWLECPDCSTEYPVGIRTDSSTTKIDTRIDRGWLLQKDCENEKCDLAVHAVGPGRMPLAPGGMAECGSCGERFVGEDGEYSASDYFRFDTRCPICQHRYRAVVPTGDRSLGFGRFSLYRWNQAVYGGNKILVDKLSFLLAKPQRWDVIVFTFDQWKNYIKRLVGLPGDLMQIWDGDLYANGKILRKAVDAPDVQEVMWTLVSDSDIVENGISHPQPVAWEVLGDDTQPKWTPLQDRTRWSINHPSDDPEPAVLTYRRGFDNYTPYNLSTAGREGEPGGHEIGDKRVAFVARVLGGSGWIGADIEDGAYAFRVAIPLVSGKARVERVPSFMSSSAAADATGVLAEAEFAGLTRGVEAEISIANVDDRVSLTIDGTEILAWEYTSCENPASPPQRPERSGLRLIGHGAEAELRSIRVWQDIYYLDYTEVPQGGRRTNWGPEGLRLEEGQYLALGDNSQSSSDGRYWSYVPEENLMGKGFLVFWPLLPHNFQGKFIR